jgi:hypothetical protein
MMLSKPISVICCILFSLAWAGCDKSSEAIDDNTPYNLSYGDSIIYLRPSAGDYIVNPVIHREGLFTAFPDGIEIDDLTGAINVSKSETGLRYRITHTSPQGKVTTTMVVLSGVTFTDHFYHLSTGDSVAHPVYNASPDRILPLIGSTFDEDNLANGGGCAVRTDNGKINLAESIRKGVFGANPQNDDKKEIEIKYRINDGSGKALNKLKVLLYWYNTLADVPQYVWDILNDRASQGVFLRNGNQTGNTGDLQIEKEARPRPPCVIIIAN